MADTLNGCEVAFKKWVKDNYTGNLRGGGGSMAIKAFKAGYEANRGEIRLTSEHSERERGDHWKGKAFDALEVLRDLVADMCDEAKDRAKYQN